MARLDRAISRRLRVDADGPIKSGHDGYMFVPRRLRHYFSAYGVKPGDDDSRRVRLKRNLQGVAQGPTAPVRTTRHGYRANGSSPDRQADPLPAGRGH
jgi:hypothetical protein